MPLFRAYLAVSADGFIARADGSVDWLHDYDPVEFGYADFIAGIGSIVMGRASYELARSFGPDWAYRDKRCLVVTSRPLDDPPPGVETRTGIPALAAELRAEAATGDVWLFGGPRLWDGFLAAGALDRFELYVIPCLLGEGMPLLPPARRDVALDLVDSRVLGRGVVAQTYAVTARSAGTPPAS
ncbi:dihydrofolate reductase family protein [Ferrovibrio sp.]|uniref:dihydrofolate reductase family protein n=1 Tax=Ferrovibrio sp. TaxID=1917215 RepID=UPI00311E925E